MPQDVTFDLPFDTPVSDHLEYARGRHLRWVWDSGLVRSHAGFEEYRSWDLPQAAARTYPHASAEDMVLIMNWFSLAFLFDDQFDSAPLRTVFLRQLADFAAAVHTGSAPLVDADAGRRAVSLIERCYSMREPLRRSWDVPIRQLVSTEGIS